MEEEKKTIRERTIDASDLPSKILFFAGVIIFLYLATTSINMIYSGRYKYVVTVMVASWLSLVIINEIPEDKKLIKKILDPLKTALNILACSTLLAVTLAGLHLLLKFAAHLLSNLAELIEWGAT